MIDPIYLIAVAISLILLIVGFFLKERYMVMIGGILTLTIGTFIMLNGLPSIYSSDARIIETTQVLNINDTFDQKYVPYTGALKDVELGSYDLRADLINSSGNITAEKDLIIEGYLYGGSPIKMRGGVILLSGRFQGNGSGLTDINDSNSSEYAYNANLLDGHDSSYFAVNGSGTVPIAYYQSLLLTTSGGWGTATTPTQVNFLVAEIIVTPNNLSNGYYFEATQTGSAAMIDKSRMIHYGKWDIYKNHVILNDGLRYNITANTDDTFNITIKYINNYYSP